MSDYDEIQHRAATRALEDFRSGALQAGAPRRKIDLNSEAGVKIVCRWKGHEMQWCDGCGDGMCPCTEGHDLPDELCDICAGR